MKKENSAPLEIERKFLIAYPSLAWLKRQPGVREVEIEQTYLTSEPDCSRRVRLWREGEETRCFRTVKRSLSDTTRIEEEDIIHPDEYRSLLTEADPLRRPVRKTRWCLPYEGHLLEIDCYPFWRRQAVLECELESEDEAFTLPPELEVFCEVTGDPRYLNSRLAGADDETLAALEILPASESFSLSEASEPC